jgi:hypothetical protein
MIVTIMSRLLEKNLSTQEGARTKSWAGLTPKTDPVSASFFNDKGRRGLF